MQKFIAHSGITSRRKAEEMIQQGRVKVNGKVTLNMGVVIEPSKDVVLIDNQPIQPEKDLIYIILHKPEGYITTISDEFNRPTVIDLIRGISKRVYPVGRLDYETSGLLLLTNDGSLTYQLTHPKHEVIKTYIAKVKGVPDHSSLKRLTNGIDIGGYITAPSFVEILKKDGEFCHVTIKIHEGKNRQVRKMFDAVQHPVIGLKRIAIGTLTLDKLPLGEWRYLTDSEIRYLKSI